MGKNYLGRSVGAHLGTARCMYHVKMQQDEKGARLKANRQDRQDRRPSHEQVSRPVAGRGVFRWNVWMKLRFQLVGSVGVDFIAPDRAESGGDWRKKQHLDKQMPLGSKKPCTTRHAGTYMETTTLGQRDIDYTHPTIYQGPPGVAVG